MLKLKNFWKIVYRRALSQQCGGAAANVDLGHCFEMVYKLCQQAGELILEARQKSKPQFTTKQTNLDLLTETDQAVEELLMEGICKHYPQHKFIAEEQTATLGMAHTLTDAPTWLIDPIDGTMNFVHSFPYYCISVGLWVHKSPVLGMIWNPVLHDCYSARQGQGALLNSEPIKCSGQQHLAQAMILHELGSDYVAQRENVLKNVDEVTKNAHAMRSLGSYAMNLCMIARGACDAFYGFGGHAWDLGAAAIIVREAGGVVLDACGGEFDLMSRRFVAAATPELAAEIVKKLIQIYPKPRDDEQPRQK